MVLVSDIEVRLCQLGHALKQTGGIIRGYAGTTSDGVLGVAENTDGTAFASPTTFLTHAITESPGVAR